MTHGWTYRLTDGHIEPQQHNYISSAARCIDIRKKIFGLTRVYCMHSFYIKTEMGEVKYMYCHTCKTLLPWRSLREKRKRSYSILWQKPLHRQKIQKATWQHKNATKNFDYTTIADRLRTVSRGNDSHPTGAVNPVNGIPFIHSPQHLCNQRHEHADVILQLADI